MKMLLDMLVWVAINIFVTAVLPIIALLIPKVPKKTRPFANGLVLKAVQDGQLFWVAVALCAVGCYEFGSYIDSGKPLIGRVFAVCCIIGLIGVLCTSIALVLLQALDIPDTKVATPLGGSVSGSGTNVGNAPSLTSSTQVVASTTHDAGLVRVSIWCLVAAAVVASIGHYFAASAAESAILLQEERITQLTKCLSEHVALEKCQQKGAAQ